MPREVEGRAPGARRRFLFIDTPFNVASPRTAPRVYLPMAALYLGTALARQGGQPVIYDPKLGTNPVPHDGVFYHGDTLEEIEARIAREDPDVVCVTNLLSKDMNNALAICRAAKRAKPGVPTIVGGIHATLFPQDFLADPAVDIVARGEGERTIVDLADWVEGRRSLDDIPGLALRGPGNSLRLTRERELIADLDELGFPDFELVDLEAYFRLWKRGFGSRPLLVGSRCLPVFTSRGCPYRCYFCAAHHIVGHKPRAHSAEAVLAHLAHLVERYHIDAVTFEDDHISFERARFEAIVDGLAALPRRLAWCTPNGVRADTLVDKPLLRKMRASGCRYLVIGVESGCQEFLKKTVRKALDLDKVVALAAACREARLPLFAFFIIGFPEETRREIQETLDFAAMLSRRHAVVPYVTFAIPIPGTEMHEAARRRGYLVEEITPRSLVETISFKGRGKIRTPEFTPEELADLIRRLNRRVLWNQLRHSLTDFRLGRQLAALTLGNLARIKAHFSRR